MRLGRHWILGIALAALGVAMARGVAPHATAGRIAWTLGGEATALSGLAAIAIGTKRKYAAGPQAPQSESEENRRGGST